LGYAGADFDPLKVSLIFSSQAGMITLLNDGAPITFDEDEAKKVLSETSQYGHDAVLCDHRCEN
jgi:glutamate N-acetyltransferase/amino-acid N-acetyltransferase